MAATRLEMPRIGDEQTPSHTGDMIVPTTTSPGHTGHTIVSRTRVASSDELEPTDAQLAALSAQEEEAVLDKGRSHHGGADGHGDAYQSYLQDIRGLALVSHAEELLLAKRSAAG